ncbi:MAG: hypothetical protein HKM04_08990 [Legionellales bacterium]|nr:hypothetical protein [Legionellales bacterium]
MHSSQALLTPGTENSVWDYSNLNFSEYLVWARNLLQKNRCDLTPESQDTILSANMPFEFKPCQSTPTRKGILLVHGLLSSPLSMHDIGLYWKKQNFLVRGMLLPGHGTRPGDLLKVSLSDWAASIEFGINSLRQEVDEIWLGGLSGGASLVLHSALTHSDVQGLLLFAPSLKLKNPLAPFLPSLDFVHKKLSIPYWPEIQEENDYAKYRSYPLHFGAQAHKLTHLIQQETRQKKLSCPLWVILAEDDETICNKAVMRFFLNTPHPASRLLIYAKYVQNQPDKRIIYRNSHFPHENILDFSHACLTFSPENSHYGRHGDYLPPLHEAKKTANHAEYRGALSRYNLKQYRIRRLSYNPDFQTMMKQLSDFML